MQVKEIKEVAKALGIAPGNKRKADLIRSIQVTEGNFDCFASAYNKECDQLDCLWRKDCFSSSPVLQ